MANAWENKTLGEMTPSERRECIARVTTKFQKELDTTIDKLPVALEED